MTLHCSNADLASVSDGTVAHALEQQVENCDFGWREVEIGHGPGSDCGKHSPGEP